MGIKALELEEYVESSLEAIKNAVAKSGFRVIEPIEFDVAVVNTSEGGGNVRVYVATAKGNLKSEKVSHIKLKVGRGLGYTITKKTI